MSEFSSLKHCFRVWTLNARAQQARPAHSAAQAQGLVCDTLTGNKQNIIDNPIRSSKSKWSVLTYVAWTRMSEPKPRDYQTIDSPLVEAFLEILVTSPGLVAARRRIRKLCNNWGERKQWNSAQVLSSHRIRE